MGAADDVLSARLVEDVVRDVRHTGRGLRRSPGFAIAVVLTLALGIGGNTAMFSVVDQLLLRPLPYPDGEQLVRIYETGLKGNRFSTSPANWLDWQRTAGTLQGVAAWRTDAMTLTGVGGPIRLNAQIVSWEFFPLHLPVIGVVGDVREGSVRDNAKPTVFYSHRQMPEIAMTLFVRANQPTAIARSAVGALHELDPNLAVTKVRTFEAAIAESLARERLSALVSGAFALSGLLIACVGLYGLLAFLVAERTKEIGIRIALGAQLGRLTRSVVGRGLRLVAIGATIGVAGSILLLRLLGALLFGVTPYDLSTYATVLIFLGAVAGVAAYVPARRAARVDPLVALRQE